ncbi:hypothetical protein GCM10009555_083020 [Acrocarpospora macrocephala]
MTGGDALGWAPRVTAAGSMVIRPVSEAGSPAQVAGGFSLTHLYGHNNRRLIHGYAGLRDVTLSCVTFR